MIRRVLLLLNFFLLPLLLLPLLPATGCSTLHHGTFRSDGFYFKRFGYSICFANKKDKLFINKNWEVENYTLNHLKGTFKIKTSKIWIGFKLVDRNNDAVLEKEKDYIYDLLLEHMQNPGVIWVQTFELQPHHAHKKLEIFLKSYADSLQATGDYKDGNVYHKLKMKKEYKVDIEGKQYIQIKNSPAIVGTILIRDRLRLKADPKTEGKHIVVVLTKMSSLETDAIGETSILLIGYHNTSRLFTQHTKEFYEFLNRIRFTTTSRCK